MGKICKYSNLYDKDGKFLHGPGPYTIQECEELVDKLAEEAPDSKAYANAMATLMSMYEKYGNPHKDEIVQKVNEYVKTKTTKAEVTKALEEVNITESSDSSNETNETIAA